MAFSFIAYTSRGTAAGEPMEACKDADGFYVLFDPKKRRRGSVKAADCIRVRSSEEAARLTKQEGHSMRMRLIGAPSVPPSMVKADSITVIDQGR